MGRRGDKYTGARRGTAKAGVKDVPVPVVTRMDVPHGKAVAANEVGSIIEDQYNLKPGRYAISGLNEQADLVAILNKQLSNSNDQNVRLECKHETLRCEHESIKECNRQIDQAFQHAEMILNCSCISAHVYLIQSSLFIRDKNLVNEFVTRLKTLPRGEVK
jgi:hypothetical protein